MDDLPEKLKDQVEKHSRNEISSDNESTLGTATSTGLQSDVSSPGEPMMIGGYRIIRKIGAGGMGVVYEAEQQQPKRLVALKVIQGAHLFDEQTVKQFEREARALALLKHPGIASIYESGRTPDGQHFFAMELVRGDTLEAYLKKSAEAGPVTPAQLRERLAIFRKISDAITYAHQRGVIHRDLKPSNIIVHYELEFSDSGSDHVPGIKILDFGLARITETDLAATRSTEIGKIQGTLPYMSPEQIRGNPDEIDVRSDVYSLGVILYEMIAGRRPYDVHHAMWHEAARIICEVPPERLTRTWSGTRRLDRDVETIVAKALEKEAQRRYQSVAALGEDISRFLTNQPILARPPSAIYQLRKMAVRHKLGFAFAGLLLVLISAFGVVMSVQARRIAGERDRSQKVSDFLISIFQAPDPYQAKGKEVTAREILDAGSARISTELKNQPEIRATMFDTMGVVYKNLGLYDKAIDLVQSGLKIREQRLGRNSIETAKSIYNLGELRLGKGDEAVAEQLFREALEIRRKELGPETLAAAEALNGLAVAAYQKGDRAKSEQLFRESLAIHRKAMGSENPQVATLLNNLAMVLDSENKLKESEILYREALSIQRKLLGSDHPSFANSINNLAMLLMKEKNFPEAEKLFQEALAINRKAFGESHPEVSANLNNLALVNLEWKRFPQAEEQMRRVIAMREKYLGANNYALCEPVQTLGVVLLQEKKYLEAEQVFRRAIRLRLLKAQEKSLGVATTKSYLGAALLGQKRFSEAEPLLVQGYEFIKASQGIKHDRTRRAGLRLIEHYNTMGKQEKAAAVKAELENGN